MPDKFQKYLDEGDALLRMHPDFEQHESVLTTAADQIATILHGVFGRTPFGECADDVDTLIGSALHTFEGDYEDMGQPVCRDCGAPVDGYERCDSCETQARYDRAAEGAYLASRLLARVDQMPVKATYDADEITPHMIRRLAEIVREEYGEPLGTGLLETTVDTR